MEYPKRKHTRLKCFDYRSPACYFVTICTHNRSNLFAKVSAVSTSFEYTTAGCLAIINLQDIPNHFPSVYVEKFVVMPNHVHALIRIAEADSTPNLSTVIGSYKSSVSKAVGSQIWQRSFYDHIIRDDADFQNIWLYIDTNPLKWSLDCFYRK